MSSEQQRESTDEELRAAYEAQVKKLRVDHILLETVVSLANLGMRRTGLSAGTEDERDPGQVRMAIEAIRALMPLVEQAAPQQAAPLRDALSQLQLAFLRIGGAEGGSGSPAGESGGGSEGPGGGPEGSGGGPEGSGGGPSPSPEPSTESKRDEPGPAQRSGRLWVPGQ